MEAMACHDPELTALLLKLLMAPPLLPSKSHPAVTARTAGNAPTVPSAALARPRSLIISFSSTSSLLQVFLWLNLSNLYFAREFWKCCFQVSNPLWNWDEHRKVRRGLHACDRQYPAFPPICSQRGKIECLKTYKDNLNDIRNAIKMQSYRRLATSDFSYKIQMSPFASFHNIFISGINLNFSHSQWKQTHTHTHTSVIYFDICEAIHPWEMF